MGTKRVIHNFLDTLSNIGEHNFRHGRSSRDPSPQPKMTTPSEKERDYRQEETWKRQSEAKRKKDKSRKASDSTLVRQGERELNRDDGRSENGRPLSNAERGTDPEVTTWTKISGTFPRISKHEKQGEKRMMFLSSENSNKIEERQLKNRQRAQETVEREREKQKHKDRKNDEVRLRITDERESLERWPIEDKRWRKGSPEDRGNILQERTREATDIREAKERDPLRKRDNIRSDTNSREHRRYSSETIPDREAFMDRRWEHPRRDIRSDRDFHDQSLSLERVRYREGDDRAGSRPRDRVKEDDRGTRRGGGNYMDTGIRSRTPEDDHKDKRRGSREPRATDSLVGRRRHPHRRSRSDCSPRVCDGREYQKHADDERYRRRRDSNGEMVSRERTGEMKRKKDDLRCMDRNEERSQKTQNGREMAGSPPVRGRMWLEPQKGKHSKDKSTEKERHRKKSEGTSEDQRHVKSQGEKRKEEDEKYLNSLAGIHGERKEYQKGGLEEARLEDRTKREAERRQKKPQSDSGGGTERERLKNGPIIKVSVNSEESDKGEGSGGDRCAYSESDVGSEVGGNEEQFRMSSGEEAFEAASSGGGWRSESKSHEEDLENSKISHEYGVAREETLKNRKGHGGREGAETAWKGKVAHEDKQESERETNPAPHAPGQLPETTDSENPNSGTGCSPIYDTPYLEENTSGTSGGLDVYTRLHDQDTDSDHNSLSEVMSVEEDTIEGNHQFKLSPETQDTESVDDTKLKVGRPVKRDSQTERLLKQWREKNNKLQETDMSKSGGDDSSRGEFEQTPTPNQINLEDLTPEKMEAIRIRMSGAWSTEDPQNDSQGPHLIWAEKVVHKILGYPKDEAADEPHLEADNQKEVKRQQEDTTQRCVEVPTFRFPDDKQSEDFEGTRQNPSHTHTGHRTVTHLETNTNTHPGTQIITHGESEHICLTPKLGEQMDYVVNEKVREIDKEISLNQNNIRYKCKSCPLLNYDSDSDCVNVSRVSESEFEEDTDQNKRSKQRDKPTEGGSDTAVSEFPERHYVENRQAEGAPGPYGYWSLDSKSGFRRRGIRKTAERRNGAHEQKEEDEGVAKDRKTRIFLSEDDEDVLSKSLGNTFLSNRLHRGKPGRTSKFFGSTPLYQQYSEAAQNSEIQRQARNDILSLSEDPSLSPLPSPPPARRPLPPLPDVIHPHSLTNQGSITSTKSLPVPDLAYKGERRASSPRLSISKSATLWRDLPGVRDNAALEDLTEDQWRLQEVRFEVVTSEASYCRSLDVVVEQFAKCEPLLALLSNQEKNWLFSRLTDVKTISQRFLEKLEERVDSDIMSFTVCDIIANHCKRFKTVYVPYLTNQSYQDATYQRLMNENPAFKQLVEKIEKSPVCQRLPLRSFLVLPFQRITRIKLLVQNIVKRTTPGTPEAKQAIKALKLLEKMIQESNESISQMKNIEALVSLSAQVDFECKTLPLISQSRRMVREGPVTELMDFSLKDTERTIYLHLFNDYLLLSLQKEGGRFTVINHAPVNELRVENCRVKLHTLQKNLFRLHISGKGLLLRTDTLSDKLRWMSAISRRNDEIDFSTAHDYEQMQCVKAYMAHQPDELSLEKADIILVHPESSDTWVEGTRLSDRQRGWVPKTHLETITNSRVKNRNLADALKLTTATAAD